MFTINLEDGREAPWISSNLKFQEMPSKQFWVNSFCEFSLTVVRHVLAKNQSQQWTIWQFKSCLKKGFEVETLKSHQKDFSRPYLVSQAVDFDFLLQYVFWLFIKIYTVWRPCHQQLKNIVKTQQKHISLNQIYDLC